MLLLDIGGSLLAAMTWSLNHSDYALRGVDQFFPTLVPIRLWVGMACILVSITADFLLLMKSKRGFMFAWCGLGLVAVGLVVASIMHFTPSSPVSPANSAELTGILTRELFEVVFNLTLLASLLRLKQLWRHA